MADERTYTVPLRHGFSKTPRYRRTKRAVATLREFLMRHMKVEEENVRIGAQLNEFLWENGIKNPPPRVTITVSKDAEGIVRAELQGVAYKEAVKPQAAKEEPQGLKEKIQAAIGKDEKPEEPAVTSDEKPEPKKRKTPKKAEEA